MLGKTPALVISDDRFEPPAPVWAALIWTACRSGRVTHALKVALRAGRNDPMFAAFAALLLLDAGKRPEAWAFAGDAVTSETSGGFLVAFVAAEFAATVKDRRRLHAVASRRVSTPDQKQAIVFQEKRFKSSPVLDPRRPSKKPVSAPPTDAKRSP